jgi:hypothetical protein
MLKKSNPLLQDIKVQAINDEFKNQMANLFLAAAGTGAAFRGGQGLVNMYHRNMKKDDTVNSPLAFSVPTKDSPPDPSKIGVGYPKAANIIGDALSYPGKVFSDWASGASASKPQELPLYYAGMGAAGTLGLYGGYKGMNSVMNSRRKAEISTEEDNARMQYEKALADLSSKQGSKFAKLYEKKSFSASQAASMGVGAMLPIAGASGLIAYNVANSRRRSKLLENAIKHRHREQLAESPVFAYPANIDMNGSSVPGGAPAASEPLPV